ncbi:MAG: hypothetical protein ACE5H2_02625 [Terriglobia bacterium]
MRAAAGLKLGPVRVIVPELLVVGCAQVHFRFRKRPVVLGADGLFLLGRPMLRKGTEVAIDIRLDGVESRFQAVVDESLEGIGIAFRFTANGTPHALLEWWQQTVGLISS